MNLSTPSATQHKWSIAVVVIVLALFQLACGLSSPKPTATLPPANTPTIALPTDTLEPTATNTPEPTATKAPPIATATPDKTAAAAAKATLEIQEVFDLIADDLEDVGFSTDQGYLGFYLSDEVEEWTDSYGGIALRPIGGEPFANFVLQTDVVWNSKSGLAGCLLSFRSEKDIIDGEQYRFYLIRLVNAPKWDFEYWDHGKRQSTMTGDVQFSDSIDDSWGGRNTLTFVVNGNDITPYINGDEHKSVTSEELSEGLVSLGVFQESGETTCTYSNTWLWVLE